MWQFLIKTWDETDDRVSWFWGVALILLLVMCFILAIALGLTTLIFWEIQH